MSIQGGALSAHNRYRIVSSLGAGRHSVVEVHWVQKRDKRAFALVKGHLALEGGNPTIEAHTQRRDDIWGACMNVHVLARRIPPRRKGPKV